MGTMQSSEYNPYTGTYEYNTGYQSELERYWRRMYPQYNSYYPSLATAYAQPNYYNNFAYQQQYYQPTAYQTAYNTFNGYGTGLYASPYYQNAYNAYNTPLQYGSTLYGTPTTAYGAYNNTYYPSYIQRAYM